MKTAFLDRAKAVVKPYLFLGTVLVALAAAVPSHAGTISLPTSGYTCILTDATNPSPGSSCNSNGGVASLTGGGDSLYLNPDGIVIRGDGSVAGAATGQVATAMAVGTTIDYSYDFSLLYQTIDPNWSLVLEIADEGSSPGPATVIGGASTITGTYSGSTQTFSGSGSFTTTTATNANDYIEVYYILRVSGTSGDNAFSTLEVPGNASMDFTPVQPSGVPEPGSVGLLGAGLGCIGWKLRKRSARVS